YYNWRWIFLINLPIDSARERRAPSWMKERARTAGAEVVEGIGALQTIETVADSVIGPKLDQVSTGNDQRASLVIDRVRSILLGPRRARGLGFCVSVAHARFMADQFNRHGIAADSLSADTPRAERLEAQARLRNRGITWKVLPTASAWKSVWLTIRRIVRSTIPSNTVSSRT